MLLFLLLLLVVVVVMMLMFMVTVPLLLVVVCGGGVVVKSLPQAKVNNIHLLSTSYTIRIQQQFCFGGGAGKGEKQVPYC